MLHCAYNLQLNLNNFNLIIISNQIEFNSIKSLIKLLINFNYYFILVLLIISVLFK